MILGLVQTLPMGEERWLKAFLFKLPLAKRVTFSTLTRLLPDSATAMAVEPSPSRISQILHVSWISEPRMMVIV